MDDVEIKTLLAQVKAIAVVGLSPDAQRPSHHVSRALQGFGYRVIPINPECKQLLGETSYPRLADVTAHIDLVDVFRAPQHVPAIVDDCIALHLPALWLQEGVIHKPAAQRARDAGLQVVMDRCIYKEYQRLR